MSAFDRSRYDWYPTYTYDGVTYTPALVASSSGGPRPALATPLKIFTVHYGGAGQWLDPGDTAQELAAVEKYHAIPNRKPNEYNSASDSESITWEWAGPFRAAHSAGENTVAWGHLAVYGLEYPTEAQATRMIEGIRKARAQAVAAGYLTPDHEVLPHQGMPGASTSCPGPLYTNKSWWRRIVAPLTTAPPPPIQPPPATAQESDMIRIDLNPGTDWWVSMVIGPTTITHTVDGYHAAVLERANVAQVVVNERDMEGILRSLRATNASPFREGMASHNAQLDALWNAAQ